MRAFVVGGTHSGCGKTTVTLGLLAALTKQGLSVQPFKAGPDFIDSGLHRLATGRTSRNLDLWMCREDYVRACFARHAATADVAVVEGVMGLYDGNLSTAALAHTLEIAVILVVDAYGMAETAGPIVKGFVDWGLESGRRRIALGGVIFNRVASENHYSRLRHGIKDVPILGYLPRDLHFKIPHRHLGLVVAEESPLSPAGFDSLAESVLDHIDVASILDLSECRPALSASGVSISPIGRIGPTKTARPVARIAVASDRAFCFYYEDNMDLLRAAGGEIVFFSPLTDQELPPDIDAVYIGGGYPELYAAQLSENRLMAESIRGWAESDRPLYAECGGLMYLSESIRDFDDRVFRMAGVFPFQTAMTSGRAHLGYRDVLLKDGCILGSRSERMRGHEFHYSRIVGGDEGVEKVYAVKDGSGTDLPAEGYRYKNTLGSYIHLHFGSNAAIGHNVLQFVKKGRV